MKIRKDEMTMDVLLLFVHVMICILIILFSLTIISALIALILGFWKLFQLLLSDLKD